MTERINLSFHWFGHRLVFRQEGSSYLFIKDGESTKLSREEWEKRLDRQLQKSADLLARRIETQGNFQDRFVREGKFSLARLTGDWVGGISRPKAALWLEARKAIEQADFDRRVGNWAKAYHSLKESAAKELLTRRNFETYLDGTIAESEEALAGAKKMTAIIAGGAALTASAMIFPPLAAFMARQVWVGGISAGLSALYDLIAKNGLGSQKEDGAIWKDAALAFAGGFICGGLIPKIPASSFPFVHKIVRPILAKAIPYHYVGLDLLARVAKDHLINIRERHGDRAGISLTMGGMAIEGGLATIALLPFLGSLRKTVTTSATVIGVSTVMETYLQHRNGRALSDVDPGRFIGMSAWGHSIVVLAEAVLGGRTPMGVGTRSQILKRTLLFWGSSLLYINPSANNFSAKINDQNWGNVQTGNTWRQGVLMWPSKLMQAAPQLGPSHPLTIFVDEMMGNFTMALVNEAWSFYEGVSEIWQKGFFRKIEGLEGSDGYLVLTDYLSHEMGSFSFRYRTYLPSPLNMEKAGHLLAVEKQVNEKLWRGFDKYLTHLERRERRTLQEDMIYNFYSKDRTISSLRKPQEVTLNF